MKVRCLLIDDEPAALRVLESHIASVNGLEIVAQCKNAIEAIDVLHEHAVELIFLDIKMPKLLGTDFLRSLPNPPKIIFVTAYTEYAIEGFDLDAVDYLLKPVSFERFIKAITKAKRVMGHEVQSPTEEYKANPDAFIYLKVDKNMQKVLVNDILYIESWKDYIKVFLINDGSLMAKQSISSIESLLSNHRFLRVHRSYIVAIDKVKGFNNLYINLHSKEVPIGRLYKQAVMDAIQSK